MSSPLIRRLLGDAKGWDRPAKATAGAVNAFYRVARPLQGFFNGQWIGHPLHPLATDVAIGAWTVVLVFDLIGFAQPGAGLASAATVALWLGVLAAIGSLLSGVTDWKDTSGLERRVGFVHGLLMLLVSLLYVASGILRLVGPVDGTPALIIAIVGFFVLVVGGFLGGEMAFGFGSMVDHNAFREEVSKFIPVARLTDLSQGLNYVEAAGRPILLVRDGERISAIGDVCSHAGGPLHEGTLEQGVVTCPWHGSRFRLIDGSVERSPATFPQPAYEARVTDGQVELRSRRS
jgi:nitrite reductase/ring-hydroxylating ferredoxin subunit/uncharacterized membrane protein